MSESKALATTVSSGGSALENIRQQGAYALAERKALTDLYKMVQASEWGRALSEVTQAAMARFCLVAGIEIPSEEIDILGGRPYRNAKHWTKRMLQDESYLDHELINITNDPAQRAEVGAPDYALAVYKVKIRKLASFAPIEKIRSGEITNVEQYITTTYEANWAPSKDGKNEKGKHLDPIGFADPHKTARTRALRRGAEKSFPSTIGEKERVVVRAERELYANWTEITSDRAATAAQLPASTGGQAINTGHGEPSAASTSGAQPLPVDDRTDDEEEAPDWTKDEREDHRGTYFESITAAGLGETRKQWQEENDLPDSYNTFTRAQYERALMLMSQPTEQALLNGVRLLDFDTLEDYCRARNLTGVPTRLKELKQLLQRVKDEVDGEV